MTPIKIGALLAMIAFVTTSPTDPPDAPAPPQDETFTLSGLEQGVSFEDFCRTYAKITGNRVFFDARRVGNKTLFGIGDMTFPRQDVETVFQSIFMMHDLGVVPFGAPEFRFVLIEDIKTSPDLKQRARFVPLSEVDQAARMPGRVISTIVPLEHISAERAQRALRNLVTDHRAGFVQSIEEANSLLITNFAPTVQQMVKVVKSMDTAATTDAARAWRERMKARQRMPAQPSPGERKQERKRKQAR